MSRENDIYLFQHTPEQIEYAESNECVRVAIAQLPVECVHRVLRNTTTISGLPVDAQEYFSEDFFAQNVYFSVPQENTDVRCHTGYEHCRALLHEIDPVWANGIPHRFLSQKGSWISGFFYKDSQEAWDWARHKVAPIGLDTASWQYEDMIASNALIEQGYRGSPNCATVVLDKVGTYTWLRDQWKRDPGLVEYTFKNFPSTDELAVGFRLEASPRRLRTIHRNAPAYSRLANRYHIAQGAGTLLEECQYASPRVQEAVALSGQTHTDIAQTLANISGYREIANDRLYGYMSYLFALAAQDTRAIYRLNEKKRSGVYIKAFDIGAARNTDMALTGRDFDDAMVHHRREIGNPQAVIEYFIKETANSLEKYLGMLTADTPIRDFDARAYEEFVAYREQIVGTIHGFVQQIM